MRSFDEAKKNILCKFDQILINLKVIEKAGIDVIEIVTKLEIAKKNVLDERFSIAVFGAFSDGKSTILSSLMNRLDIDISPEPKTQDIQLYDNGNYQLVDTPGLFSEELSHDKLTTKYISEANLILYVVDPVNPLKASQHSVVRWLLSDLDKVRNTIFLVNKMDNVADLEDEFEFEEQAAIKRQVVIETLSEIMNSKVEPKVICIAADPYEQGLIFWLQQKDYQRLSRMSRLLNAIDEITSMQHDELITKAGYDVIRGSLTELSARIDSECELLSCEVDLLTNQIQEFQDNRDQLDRLSHEQYRLIKEEILALRKSMLGDIRNRNDSEQLRDYIEDNFGRDGYVLQNTIESIIDRYTDSASEENDTILHNVNDSWQYYQKLNDSILNKFGKALGEAVGKFSCLSTMQVAQKINNLNKLAGKPLKLPFWKSMKYAKTIKQFGNFAKGLPVVIDTVGGVLEYWNEKEFKKQREDVRKDIDALFKEFINDFTLSEYQTNYFPAIISLNDSIDELMEKQEEGTSRRAILKSNLEKLKNCINVAD